MIDYDCATLENEVKFYVFTQLIHVFTSKMLICACKTTLISYAQMWPAMKYLTGGKMFSKLKCPAVPQGTMGPCPQKYDDIMLFR